MKEDKASEITFRDEFKFKDLVEFRVFVFKLIKL